MRQSMCRIGFKFHALLEVDQVKLQFLRGIVHGEAGDDGVQERGLARAGLSRNQHVLRGASSQFQVLQFFRTGPSERHFDLCATVALPPIAGRRDDRMKWHFDAYCVFGAASHFADHFREAISFERRFQRDSELGKIRFTPGKSLLGIVPDERRGMGLKIFHVEASRQ